MYKYMEEENLPPVHSAAEEISSTVMTPYHGSVYFL